MTKNTAISKLEGAKLIPFSYQYNWVKCQDETNAQVPKSPTYINCSIS